METKQIQKTVSNNPFLKPLVEKDLDICTHIKFERIDVQLLSFKTNNNHILQTMVKHPTSGCSGTLKHELFFVSNSNIIELPEYKSNYSIYDNASYVNKHIEEISHIVVKSKIQWDKEDKSSEYSIVVYSNRENTWAYSRANYNLTSNICINHYDYCYALTHLNFDWVPVQLKLKDLMAKFLAYVYVPNYRDNFYIVAKSNLTQYTITGLEVNIQLNESNKYITFVLNNGKDNLEMDIRAFNISLDEFNTCIDDIINSSVVIKRDNE